MKIDFFIKYWLLFLNQQKAEEVIYEINNIIGRGVANCVYLHFLRLHRAGVADSRSALTSFNTSNTL